MADIVAYIFLSFFVHFFPLQNINFIYSASLRGKYCDKYACVRIVFASAHFRIHFAVSHSTLTETEWNRSVHDLENVYTVNERLVASNIALSNFFCVCFACCWWIEHTIISLLCTIVIVLGHTQCGQINALLFRELREGHTHNARSTFH